MVFPDTFPVLAKNHNSKLGAAICQKFDRIQPDPTPSRPIKKGNMRKFHEEELTNGKNKDFS